MGLTDTAQLMEIQAVRRETERTNQLLEALLEQQGAAVPEPRKGGLRRRRG